MTALRAQSVARLTRWARRQSPPLAIQLPVNSGRHSIDIEVPAEEPAHSRAWSRGDASTSAYSTSSTVKDERAARNDVTRFRCLS